MSDFKRRAETIDEAVESAQRTTDYTTEPLLEKLTRLDKEDPKRARILAAKIRKALPSLSTKPLSAQDKRRARQ